MKIAVITITARQNPRLDFTAKTLAASLLRAEGVDLDWIIVDELARSSRDLVGAIDLWDARGEINRDHVVARVVDRMSCEIVSPDPSPFRKGPDRLPAHNTARNTGLRFALGVDERPSHRGLKNIAAPRPADYVVFLNDCNVVTIDWVSVARDCALQGVGWKCKAHDLHDIAEPADGVVRMRDHNDRLRPVPPTTVAGACWGAPARALHQIGGFDVAYDGQKKGADLDAVLRLSRTGLVFISTERAFTVQLRRTKIASEITTSKEAHAGHRNQQLLNDLTRDKQRIGPRAGIVGDLARPLPSTPEGMARQAPPVWGVVVRRTGPEPDPAPAAVAGDARPADDAAPAVTVTPDQLAKDETYETYVPTSKDADIIGQPLADRLAEEEQHEQLLDDLGDLT